MTWYPIYFAYTIVTFQFLRDADIPYGQAALIAFTLPISMPLIILWMLWRILRIMDGHSDDGEFTVDMPEARVLTMGSVKGEVGACEKTLIQTTWSPKLSVSIGRCVWLLVARIARL